MNSGRCRQIAVTLLAALLSVSWSAAALHTHHHQHSGSAHEAGLHGGCSHPHLHVHTVVSASQAVAHGHCCQHAAADCHASRAHAGGHAPPHDECCPEEAGESRLPQPHSDHCVICEFLAQPPLPTVQVSLPALLEITYEVIVFIPAMWVDEFRPLFESRGPPARPT